MPDYSLMNEIKEMIETSRVPDANKMVARECLRKLSHISNGESGSVEAVSAALMALSPLIMGIFLTTPDMVDNAANKAAIAAAERALVQHRTEEHATIAIDQRAQEAPYGWRRFVFEAVPKAGWPGTILVLGIVYRDLIFKLITG